METKCGVPVGVRYNHRYRGPHESKKVDFLEQQIKYNLSKLKLRVTELETYMDNVTVKPDYTNTDIINKIEDIEFSLADTREELKYEQRNN